MAKDKALAPAVKYFFKRLEERADEIRAEASEFSSQHQEVQFDDVEGFFRQIMTQNIFIHTVGINGKHESTILAKAIFSMNRVVRIYYSTSFDEENSGFIRIRPDPKEQLIIVERMHGFRPVSEQIYVNHDQSSIIRFMIRWLMRRIDWDKTKLNNLDLYKRVVAQEQEEARAKIEAQIAQQEADAVQRALSKLSKRGPKRLTTR